MSESAQSQHSRLPALAMAVALIALAVAITMCVSSSVDGGEAGLSDVYIGAIPTTIFAMASVAISIAALARDVPPKWVALTAFAISAVLALFFGLPLLGALLFELESMTSIPVP